MESSIRMSKFKYGEKSVTLTLLDNNTYIKYKKIITYREYSIGWLKYLNLVIFYHRTTREKQSDALMLVHLNEDESKEISNNLSNDADDPLKMSKLHIPAFDIHHNTIGNGNGTHRISITAFDILCNPKDSSLLKTIITIKKKNQVPKTK